MNGSLNTMDDHEFYDLFSKASSLKSEEQASRSLDAVRQLYGMTQDHTLRDYTWTTQEVYNPLFLLIDLVSDEQSLMRGNLRGFCDGRWRGISVANREIYARVPSRIQ